MSNSVYLANLIEAAAKLGITNAQLAAWLGVTAKSFDRTLQQDNCGMRAYIASQRRGSICRRDLAD